MCSHVLAVVLCRRGAKEYHSQISSGVDLQDNDVPGEQTEFLEMNRGEGSSHSPSPSSPDHASSTPEEDLEKETTVSETVDRSPATDDVSASVIEIWPAGGGVGFELPTTAPPPSHPMFGTTPIPSQFTEFRNGQWEAIKETVEHLSEEDIKVVFLSAPTGSGKTLIGEMVRRLYTKDSPTPFLCTTKSLQNQIERDFTYGRVIKGRNNYRTEARPDLTTEDCDGSWAEGPDSCSWCTSLHTCPYNVAKNEAAIAPLGILNTAYFLYESRNEQSRFRGRDLVIIDEADTLENQLMNHVETVIGPRIRQQLGVHTLPKKTVAADWERWLIDEMLPAITQRQNELGRQGSLLGTPIKMQRERRRLAQLKGQIKQMLYHADESGMEENWVLTGYERASGDKDATLVFKPIRVDEVAHEVLWRMGHKFLLMSATLISPEQMAEDLGLEDHQWAFVEMPSVFPVENRPVFSVGKMRITQKTKDEAYPVLVEQVGEIIEDNPGARMLVHTVSYDLTRYLYNNLGSGRVMTYWNSGERDAALARFLDRPDAVMLAPSFERGIDLPEEDCEVQIIAKVPYPYLGDKMVKARMYSRGGKKWYAVQTIRAIVQMTGRGMRSKDDWCDVYILDRQFNRLHKDNGRLFPKWWSDALVVSPNNPKSRPLKKAAETRKKNRLARIYQS